MASHDGRSRKAMRKTINDGMEKSYEKYHFNDVLHRRAHDFYVTG
jgi:hypothetical protein